MSNKRRSKKQKKLDSKKRRFPCQVRKSSIPGAGNGLFATRNIKRGEIIGFYDGVFLRNRNSEYVEQYLQQCRDNKHCLTDVDIMLIQMEHYKQDLPEKDTVVWGYPVQLRTGGYCQIINDKFTEYRLKKGCKNDTNIYSYEVKSNGKWVCYNIAGRAYNVTLSDQCCDPSKLWFEATQNILKGEELYHSYGMSYWEDCDLGPQLEGNKLKKLLSGAKGVLNNIHTAVS
jgi:hypothetical protein